MAREDEASEEESMKFCSRGTGMLLHTEKTTGAKRNRKGSLHFISILQSVHSAHI